mmetsp:Transcript_34873/g.103359  ORF Transcript_34873/g.103359 Transcript_34873/m.103359 type:complete len:133 (-) Transcript_34873:20-418(-)
MEPPPLCRGMEPKPLPLQSCAHSEALCAGASHVRPCRAHARTNSNAHMCMLTGLRFACSAAALSAALAAGRWVSSGRASCCRPPEWLRTHAQVYVPRAPGQGCFQGVRDGLCANVFEAGEKQGRVPLGAEWR